jgi:glycosyltransferase involved in cell wall biosynthesis
MKLAIDGTGLGDGSEQRGIGTYLTHLIRGLVSLPEMDVVVLATVGSSIPEGASHQPVRRHPHYRLGPFLHDLRLPAELRATHAELAHSPAMAPPRRCPTPWVQTLHDLTPLVFDSPLLATDARRWRHLGPRLRAAAAVIAVSRSSADQGIRLLGLDPTKVHIVPHGVDAAFGPGRRGPQDPPYLLWCGSWGPHKGVREVVGVLDLLVDGGLPHRLRVVGQNDAWMQARLEEELATSRHRDRIDVLGWVDDLAQQYRSADALLVTSRAEGFGLPAAEAMACGTPVVAFDNTALPEVVGPESPLLVRDGDVVALARTTRLLLTTPSLQREESERGLARSGRLTWARTVEQHVEIYRSVLSA